MRKKNFKAIFYKITRCTLQGIGVFLITLQICLANEIIFDNKKISYTDSSSGKNVLFIYPYPIDEEARKKDTKIFEAGCRVITVDVSGLEESAPTGGKTLSIDQSVEAVNAVLVHLHIEHTVIVGELKGGVAVAMAFYKKYPEKTDEVIWVLH